jgi:prepilin peptidase CpaA
VPYHLSLAAAVAIALAGALFDWRTGKIPDRLTLGMLLVAPIAHAAWAYDVDPVAMSALRGCASSLLGAAAGGVLPFLLLRAGGVGGGDVKLCLALGAITGPGFAFHAVTYAMIAALAHGLALVVRRNALGETWRNVLRLFQWGRGRRRGNDSVPSASMTTMRFAFSILVGTCWAGAVLWDSSG